MAIVTRYFSTTAAGAGDGTTWADRAALFSSGNWSSIITGFNFSGSDSLECRIEGGLTYTCSQSLAAALFANAPTNANPLFIHGCDSSGNLLSPSNPDWVSAEPPGALFDPFPEIENATSGQQTINLNHTFVRAMRFKMTNGAHVSAIQAAAHIDWCSLLSTSGGTSSALVNTSVIRVSNCSLKSTGSNYSSLLITTNSNFAFNVRIEGNPSATGGTRRGVLMQGTTADRFMDRFCIFGHVGEGVFDNNLNVGARGFIINSVIADNDGTAVLLPSVAAQTSLFAIRNSFIVNNLVGIDAQSAARVYVTNSRFRDNTSGNLNGFGNHPTNHDIETAAGTDADEFVNAAAGDYRIKNTSLYWGRNIGAGDEPASGGGGWGFRRRARLLGA